MTKKELALKSVLNGLTLLYIHIHAKCTIKDNHYIDILLSYNRALLQESDISDETLAFLDIAIKSINEDYHTAYTSWLSRYCLENFTYDYNSVFSHIDVLLTINRRLIDKLSKEEFKDAVLISGAVVNYPDFLLGRYDMTPHDFYEEELCSYSRILSEIFLDGYEPLFT